MTGPPVTITQTSERTTRAFHDDHFIDGEWMRSVSATRTPVIDPTTERQIKLDATQHKLGAGQIKLDATQHKLDANQHKLDANQIKIGAPIGGK